MYDKELYEKALEACELSHAPYSMIMVGAAALLEDGTVVKGANFENIASPTCICAEQSLICTLNNLYNGKKIMSIAIAAKSNNNIIDISPCGTCRQTILERQYLQKNFISIIFRYESELVAIDSIDKLLPYAFKKLSLKTK